MHIVINSVIDLTLDLSVVKSKATRRILFRKKRRKDEEDATSFEGLMKN